MQPRTTKFASNEVSATVTVTSSFGHRDVYIITDDGAGILVQVQHFNKHGLRTQERIGFAAPDDNSVEIYTI